MLNGSLTPQIEASNAQTERFIEPTGSKQQAQSGVLPTTPFGKKVLRARAVKPRQSEGKTGGRGTAWRPSAGREKEPKMRKQKSGD